MLSASKSELPINLHKSGVICGLQNEVLSAGITYKALNVHSIS